MAGITSGASSDKWTIDPTSKAGRVTLYDASGNAIVQANRATVTETAAGEMVAGKEYKVQRTVRVGSTGALQVAGDETILLSDSFEGTTRNLNQWIETLTTMASAQTLATGLQLNSAGTTTTTTGILESSHRQFPFTGRTSLIFRAHLRVVGLTNCVEEWGFSDQTSATTAGHTNGAFFRRNAGGTLNPVLAFNGTETTGNAMTAPATTDYAWYEVWLEEGRATFQVVSHAGALLSSQVMEIGSSAGGAGSATQARMFTVTHIPCFLRVLNTGAAGTAPQINVTQAVVMVQDAYAQRPHVVAQSGLGLNSLTSPTAFTQLANYSNSAAPTTRTLSNTAAAETTLGGLLVANSIAGGNTDLIMFGWTNPSPYTFYFTGIKIGVPLNQVVAVATTETLFMYAMAFNSSAVSLATAAPYSPMRVALPGYHRAAVGLGVNQPFTAGADITWQPNTPLAVQPGRFLHVITRELVGTATATETYLWQVTIDGFFE